jgi:hypothetical protein
MDNEENSNEKINILTNFGDKVKKVNLEIQVDLTQEKVNNGQIKLPYIIRKGNEPNMQSRKKLRKKLVQIGNFCQSIYNNSNTTLNNTKTMEDLLNDSKIKAIEEIKNDYFVNQIQPNKEENNYSNSLSNNNSEIYKKIILNKLKPKSLKKIDMKTNINNKAEKFTYLTTTYERNSKKDKNKINYSIDNGINKKMKYNYGDYASNKLIINHPKLYILNSNRESRINRLPMINRGYKRLNVVREFSKLIPDNIILTREEKINKYDEYMKMKELKEANNS